MARSRRPFPALDWKFNEVAKYGYMLDFQMPHQILAVNTGELNKLPADLQELVLAKGKEWPPKYLQTIEDGAGGAGKRLAERGEQLIPPTAADVIARARRQSALGGLGEAGRDGLAGPARLDHRYMLEVTAAPSHGWRNDPSSGDGP